MCGIVGIVARNEVKQDIYDALTILQHRGQDAAGMVTSDGRRCYLRKDNGLVKDVFQSQHMQRLKGNVGLGQCRYPTAGSTSSAEAQPLYVNSPYGIALAHNGNLTNTEELMSDLFAEDLRHINTSSDSEVLLNVLANELSVLHAINPSPTEMFKAVGAVHQRCRGAYAVVAMVIGSGLLGFRDPFGIRPLVYGSRETESGTEYMLASESVALDILGYTRIDDVAPGEAIFISNEGEIFRHQCAANPKLMPCIFEHVYFARPDSIIDDISVYKSRLRMGEHLARRILGQFSQHDHDIDVVIPIPDTSRVAGQSLAYELGVKFREGFMKNRYIGRTFIMPGQKQRQKSVRHKLNAIDLEFKGKNVLLVDDSIVRGTTSTKIVEMIRAAGASEVHMRIASPPTTHSCFYGVDTPERDKLMAARMSVNEMATAIGVDSLAFISIDGLYRAMGQAAGRSADAPGFCDACFTGDYPIRLASGLSAKRVSHGGSQ